MHFIFEQDIRTEKVKLSKCSCSGIFELDSHNRDFMALSLIPKSANKHLNMVMTIYGQLQNIWNLLNGLHNR